MNSVEFILRKMDVFYVPFNPSLNLKYKEIESSSIIGGIISIVIYTFALIYGIVLLKQWLYYEMPFKIATQAKNSYSDFFNTYFAENPFYDTIDIEITYNIQVGIDYFKSDEVIFIPLLYDSNSDQTINLLDLYNIKSEILTFKIPAGLVDSEMYFFLVACHDNEMFLDINQKCANKEIFDQKLSLAGIEIDFTISTGSFDAKTKIYQYHNLTLQVSSKKIIQVQNSFLWNTRIIKCLKDSFKKHNQNIWDQMGTLDYVTQYSKFFNKNVQSVYAALQIDSSNVITEVLISYPTISEQLASIGSITQVLLLSGIVIRFMNRRQMILEFKKEFRNKFFPEITFIQRHKVGKSYQYFYQNKKINQQSYSEFIKETETKIDEKLNYFNLIYEVSRIQIIFEEITTQYKILQSHMKYFELDLIYCRSDKEYHIINYWGLKSETKDMKKRTSLAPFSLNYSTLQQSEQFCKTLTSEHDLAPHITICNETKFSSVRFCESKSIRC